MFKKLKTSEEGQERQNIHKVNYYDNLQHKMTDIFKYYILLSTTPYIFLVKAPSDV